MSIAKIQNNVDADLGNPDAETMLFKAQLTRRIAAIMAKRKLTQDSAHHATQVVNRAALAEGIHRAASKPVLHGDNGATLKATTVLAMLNWLGVKPSYSRPARERR